jgi:hypothetical protein
MTIAHLRWEFLTPVLILRAVVKSKSAELFYSAHQSM